MFYLLTCHQIGAVSCVLPLNMPSNRRCLYISRNDRSSLPLRGGRWREAPDEGGRTALTFFPLHRNSDAVSKRNGITVAAFPRVGKVARQRRMRAKSASGTTCTAFSRTVQITLAPLRPRRPDTYIIPNPAGKSKRFRDFQRLFLSTSCNLHIERLYSS